MNKIDKICLEASAELTALYAIHDMDFKSSKVIKQQKMSDIVKSIEKTLEEVPKIQDVTLDAKQNARIAYILGMSDIV